MRLHFLRRSSRDLFLSGCDTLYGLLAGNGLLAANGRLAGNGRLASNDRLANARGVNQEGGGILLVRLDGIGDFILWLSSARLLREHYETVYITLVAEASFSEFAAGLGYFDEVIPVARQRLTTDLAYRYEIFDRVRLRRYDTAIHPCYNRVGRFRDAEAVMRVAHASRKVGSIGEPSSGWQQRVSRRWYSELVPASSNPLHELDRNAEFMRALGLSGVSASVAAEPARPTRTSLFDGLPYYVLVPGAGFPIRQWPAEHFAELAERISRETGWTGVLCGGPQDAPLADRVAQLAAVELLNYAGRTSLVEYVDLIRGARLLVGNETGAVHIAAMVDTPCVSITGGGHFGRFVPYPAGLSGPLAASHGMSCFQCNWECAYPLGDDEPAPCVAKISADAVWTQVQSVLRTKVKRYDPRRVRSE